MFSCCHPRLSESAQVALILHILCGFSVAEVADAFLSSHAAIEKRITRAKSLLSATHAVFDVSAAEEFAARLPSVLRALYLLFNEGYHGASPAAIRCELCDEAIRLTALLLEHPFGVTPATHSLAALMALISARLPARTDASGELVALADQDRTKWDRARIAEGLRLLDLAARGMEISPYHVEAAIAAVHARAARAQDTDWRLIVSFYDLLMRIRPSPVIALNRAIAISQAEGPQRGLEELRAHVDANSLPRYLFYPAALGEMELSLGKREDARVHFQSARDLARNDLERSFIDRRLRACEIGGTGESL
jgi:RNA polymerase sigma-70 factor (ECF subfamily)